MTSNFLGIMCMEQWWSKFSIVITALMLSAVASFAQKNPIEGIWISSSGAAKIQIEHDVDGSFQGKIIWLKNPLRDGHPKVDARNPTESLRSRPILGMQILKGLRPDGDKEYDDGDIYDPQSGKHYDCKAELESPTELHLRGYMGISLVGKTTVWTRSH